MGCRFLSPAIKEAVSYDGKLEAFTLLLYPKRQNEVREMTLDSTIFGK